MLTFAMIVFAIIGIYFILIEFCVFLGGEEVVQTSYHIIAIVGGIIFLLLSYLCYRKRKKQKNIIKTEKNKKKTWKTDILIIINTIIVITFVIIGSRCLDELLISLKESNLFVSSLICTGILFYLFASIEKLNYLFKKYLKFWIITPFVLGIGLLTLILIIFIPQMEGVLEIILLTIVGIILLDACFIMIYFLYFPYFNKDSLTKDSYVAYYFMLFIYLFLVSIVTCAILKNITWCIVLFFIICGIYCICLTVNVLGIKLPESKFFNNYSFEESSKTNNIIQKNEKTQEEDELYYFTKYDYTVSSSYIESTGKYEYTVDVTYHYKNAKGYTKTANERFFGSDYSGTYANTVRSLIETGYNKYFEPRK